MVRSYLNNLLTKGCSAFLHLYLILLPCYDAIFIWKGHKWQIKRFVKSMESTLQLRTEIKFSVAINWMNKNLNIFFPHFYGKLELVKVRKVARINCILWRGNCLTWMCKLLSDETLWDVFENRSRDSWRKLHSLVLGGSNESVSTTQAILMRWMKRLPLN